MQERVRSKKEHFVVLLSLQRGDSNEKNSSGFIKWNDVLNRDGK